MQILNDNLEDHYKITAKIDSKCNPFRINKTGLGTLILRGFQGLTLNTLYCLSAKATDALPGVDSNHDDLGLGWRLMVITVFLSLMWFGLKSFAERIKTGKIEVPKFLQKSNKLFSGLASWNSKDKLSAHPKFNLEPIQRQIFPDGSELWVIENEGRYLLLSKTLQSGIRYLSDLKSPVEATENLSKPIDKAFEHH